MSFDNQNEEVVYADFWTRFGAYILDVIIIAPISLGLNYVNFITLKSFFFYLFITLLLLLYKPFFEFKYGATYGKMATNLKVTDYQFQKIDFERSFIRSLIFIIPSILLLPVQYMAYNNPSLISLDSFWEFNTLIASTYPIQGLFSCFVSITVITDLIVLLTDETKRQRSLHDRIAKTYVVKKN